MSPAHESVPLSPYSGYAFSVTHEEFIVQYGNRRMGEIVNLRTVRKRASRFREEARAAENRAAFGRSKADRQRNFNERGKAARHLDRHRIETGDDR